MTTIKYQVAILATGLAFLTVAAHAGIQNDVPSCYAANKMEVQVPMSKKELFVLVDQTTLLDDNLKRSVGESIYNFLTQGTAFTIAQFSSFSQGRYMEIDNAGNLEQTIPKEQRDSISERKLGNFDACMKGQQAYGVKLAWGSAKKAMDGAANGLAKSDIMASLRELSKRVRQSRAQEKVVFVISDMLENSSISSFYTHGNVRKVDPAKELKVAVANHMMGDFGGARVYVLGAGIVSETGLSRGVYRDPKAMEALKEFWTEYFNQSNAKLVEFGEPEMMSAVQ